MTIEKRAKQSRKLSNNDIGGLLDWLFSPISSKGTSSPTSSTSTSNLSSWEQVLHKYAAAQICRVIVVWPLAQDLVLWCLQTHPLIDTSNALLLFCPHL